MKKLWPVVIAVLTGCILAFILFKNVEKKTINEVEGNAVAVQIGVFTKEENAISMRDSIGGIILEDEGLYRVYYSVLRNQNNLNFITAYLKNKGISYYLKKIKLSDVAIEELDGIEALMDKTSMDTKIKVNEELLGSIKEVI